MAWKVGGSGAADWVVAVLDARNAICANAAFDTSESTSSAANSARFPAAQAVPVGVIYLNRG
jgi:hypothetical protein